MKGQLQISAVSKGLMFATIILIAAFQCYWMAKLYKDEWRALQRETDVLFRDVVYKLQVQRFKSDTTIYKKGQPDNLFVFDVINDAQQRIADSILVNSRGEKKDTLRKHVVIALNGRRDENRQYDRDVINNDLENPDVPFPPPPSGRRMRFFSSNKSLSDSLPLSKIDSAYKAELAKSNIDISYKLICVTGKPSVPGKPPIPGQPSAARPSWTRYSELKTDFTFVGLAKSYGYQATFDNPFSYIISELASSILISFLLVAFTTASFVFLYRNLIAQRRLAVMKNDFISNITHELKTPISTVNVAIEALRNFNAIDDPEKRREYLDISAAELQRLSLLVDKVLRLSMFENKEVELRKEPVDLKALTEEVIAIMKLQLDKLKAVITLTTEGDRFTVEADRMHLTSVLYNLLDNALKYRNSDPVIDVSLKSRDMHVELKVKDNGIGIPSEYKGRVFEKFFRVPTDDVHNTKGYGLGLSYVSHIVRRHFGFITVDSEPGKGSTFTANIPYKEADEIWFDDKRRLRKIIFRLSPKKES